MTPSLKPSSLFPSSSPWYEMVERYEEFRPHQYETAVEALSSPKKIVMVIGPPGFGKSLSAVVLAGLANIEHGWRTVICTKTINLQHQYHDEFGMRVMMGRSNYPCIAGHAPNAAQAPCVYNLPCIEKENDCTYYNARSDAAEADLLMVNYDLLAHGWPSRGSFTSPLNRRQLIIGDEAHLIEGSLRAADAAVISGLSFRRLLDMDYPPPHHTVSDALIWQEWAAGLMSRTEGYVREAKDIKANSDDTDTPRYKEIQGKLALNNLATTIHTLIGSGVPIAFIREGNQTIITPVYADGSFHNLMKGTEKIVLMSATLPAPDIYASMLGLSKEDYEVIEVPSEFPASRRPFYTYPVVRVGWKMSEEDVDDLVTALDTYLERWQDRKVLVHTGSYQLQQRVLDRSRTPISRRVFHGPKGVAVAIDRFRKGGPGTVLLSPTARVGVDLPGDDLRGQIILKLPFPDRKDPVVRAREELVPESYAQSTVADLLQMYGRGMRYKEDWCDTICLDRNFTWFYRQHHRMFPSYFKEAVRR